MIKDSCGQTPKENGFYWFYKEGSSATVIELDEIPDDPTIYFIGNDTPYEFDEVDGIVYGPITPQNIPHTGS